MTTTIKSDLQLTEYRTTDNTIRTSTVQMTQVDAIAATKSSNMKGYHIADSKEISILMTTNPHILKLLDNGRVITAEQGLSNLGPCEILNDGTRRQLFEVLPDDFDYLSDKRFRIEKMFAQWPSENRAWQSGGAGAVILRLGHDHRETGRYADYKGVDRSYLYLYTGNPEQSEAWVVWVQDSSVAGTTATNAEQQHAVLLRN